MKKILLFILFLIFISFKSFSIPFVNPDSTDYSKNTISAWYYNMVTDTINSVVIDTTLDAFQFLNPIFKNSPFNTFLGNLGLPLISNSIFLQKDNPEFKYENPYYYYLFHNENIEYYNTKRPFSNVVYTNGPFKTQTISLIHTQNINPYWNAGFKYSLITSPGEYKRQNSKINALTFFSSYDKLRLSTHFNFIFNKLYHYENGGIVGDTTNQVEQVNPAYRNVNLQNAQNKYKNFELFFNQEYRFGKIKIDSVLNTKIDTASNSKDTIKYLYHKTLNPKASIIYRLNYSNYFKVYTDENPFSGFYIGMYKDSISTVNQENIYTYFQSFNVPVFIDSTLSYDSVYYRNFSNSLQFKINENKNRKIFPFAVGIQYKYDLIKAHTYADDTLLFNSSVIFSMYKLMNKFKWILSADYYLSGYNKGNIKFHFDFINGLGANQNNFLVFNIDFKRLNPNYFENHTFYNNFKWDSAFIYKDITKICLKFERPKNYFTFLIFSRILDNYIYYNEHAYPQQETSTFNCYGAEINKTFKLKWFSSKFLGIYQTTDNEAIYRIPNIILYNSSYFTFSMFKKILKVDIGFDTYYCSEYLPYSYMPATGVFYIQNAVNAGNYPTIDAFLSLQLKRARFFLKMSHLNDGLINNENISVPGYPLNGRGLGFGLSWNFYN